MSGTQTQYIIYGALLVLTLWLIFLTLRYYTLAKTRKLLSQGLNQGKDIERVISEALSKLDELERQQRKTAAALADERRLLGRTGRYVSLVRYDAFNDVGGKLSFSTALLNETGQGIVITSIIGRNENRVYAKPVQDGASPYQLSAEEERAIAEAWPRKKSASRTTEV